MSWNPVLSIARIRKISLWLVIVFAFGGVLFGLGFSLGVVLGGLIAMVNLAVFVSLVSKLIGTKPKRISWLGSGGVLFRYILLCIALFVIIGIWHVNVVALALGLSTVFVAAFIECVLYAYRESNKEH